MVPLPSSFVVLVVATFAADSLDIGMAQHIAEQQMLDIDTAQHNAEMPPLQPNPPVWPDSVTVFGPDDAAEANAVMTRLSTTLNDRAAGHFSDERRAFLFKPGAYEMDVAVGYYVSVHGLGASPGDVVVAGPRGIYVDAMDKRAGGAGSLDTFWRSMENLERVGDLRWAVSQAAPLRRVRVGGDLVLHDGGAYASGGFLANAAVGGRVDFGSQQQWASRTSPSGAGPRAAPGASRRAPGSSLLEWDGDGGVLSDVFARVGGPGSRAARADTMVRVAGAGVVLDNVWLWRADHAALAPGEAPRPGEVYHLVADGECYSETGLVVDGDDVVAYGLAVEHTLGDQMIWRGERGRVFFYQSELPYDVDQAFADAGHVGYRVTAAAHESVGAGIYSFFRDSQCLVPAAVAAPPTANFTTLHAPNGHPGILSVT
ncbi:hypothetical protein JL720_5031 [Aureococcus anophagefferens]|nr:hypothetical protein JL720_5031 [Aureococcus anophagefferens]